MALTLGGPVAETALRQLADEPVLQRLIEALPRPQDIRNGPAVAAPSPRMASFENRGQRGEGRRSLDGSNRDPEKRFEAPSTTSRRCSHSRARVRVS
jgi:hypothetical protein